MNDPFEFEDPFRPSEPARKKPKKESEAPQSHFAILDYLKEYQVKGDPERGGVQLVAKKRKPANHNKRSEQWLNERFIAVSYEERHIRTAEGLVLKKDLFGFIDYMALDENKVKWGVQVTSENAKSARIRKMATLKSVKKWLADGNRILLLLWWQPDGHGRKWEPKPIEVTQEILDESNARAEKLARSKASKKKKGWLG